MASEETASVVHVLVLHDVATTDIGEWARGVLQTGLAPCTLEVQSRNEAEFFTATAEDLRARPGLTVAVVVFFDGQTDVAKDVFLRFRGLAEERAASLVVQALNAKKGAHTLFENDKAVVSSLQKKIAQVEASRRGPDAAAGAAVGGGSAGGGGDATSAAAAAASGEGAVAAAPLAAAPRPLGAALGAEGADPSAGAGMSADGVTGAPAQSAIVTSETPPDRIAQRVRDSQGEAFALAKGANAEQLAADVRLLTLAARAAGCGVFPVTNAPKPLTAAAAAAAAAAVAASAAEASTPAAPGQGAAAVAAAAPAGPAPVLGAGSLAQEFMMRLDCETTHIEMRVAMCGNVDSGKSTLTSVLTRGCKDDGRGFARAKVFNHRHECETGRTSSISENHLGFAADGSVVNYPPGGPTGPKSILLTPHEFATRSAKIVTLYDLAGHEKYLKTTVLGMTRSLPDYGCIVISANNGIQRMTKEHLGLCLALKLPFFVVVTRIDATPENVRVQTLQTITKLLKMPMVKKLPYPVKNQDDVAVCAKNLRADRITPIFEVSNVTGQGIAEVLHFLNLLPVRRVWSAMLLQPKEMIIDSTFFVTGVGTVVGGIVTQGCFRPNDTLLLGPDSLGAFRQVQIKSIHVKGVDADKVEAGNDGALCLKKEKRSAIRKGMVLVDPSTNPRAHWQFEAEIVILYHATTIANNYEPVVHSQTVRQSARIVLVQQEVLRTGDRAIVRFHFLYRPEFLKIGQRLIFREGRTKGIGTITRLLEDVDESVAGNVRQRAKETVREKHSGTSSKPQPPPKPQVATAAVATATATSVAGAAAGASATSRPPPPVYGDAGVGNGTASSHA